METAGRRSAVARWAERSSGDDPFGFWALERRTDGVVAGRQLLVPLDRGEHSEVEIGWHFHPDSWGHGLASESARAVHEHGWRHGLDEIHAAVRRGTDASMAVCRRIGMEHPGPTVQYYPTGPEHFALAREPIVRG